jgi:hypothetical protein
MKLKKLYFVVNQGVKQALWNSVGDSIRKTEDNSMWWEIKTITYTAIGNPVWESVWESLWRSGTMGPLYDYID